MNLDKQHEELHWALARQREEFKMALAEANRDLLKMLMSHLWKVYGVGALMLGGVYFIARYVH
jgi:hypothetical protein